MREELVWRLSTCKFSKIVKIKSPVYYSLRGNCSLTKYLVAFSDQHLISHNLKNCPKIREIQSYQGNKQIKRERKNNIIMMFQGAREGGGGLSEYGIKRAVTGPQ